MSVAQRKDGRWLVKFKTETGRWSQRSFKSEAEARQFDADCQYDRVENSRLTVLEAVLVFLKNVPHVAKTVELYRYIVCGTDRKDGGHNAGPAEILAERYVDTLTRRDLETVRENCRRAGNRNRSINSYTGRLNAAFNWCVQQDLLHENPWKKYRGLPERDSGTRAGTLEEFARLYPELPAWLQWASQTAIALCLRPGVKELFALEWRHFDWRAGLVRVDMPKVGRAKTVFPPRPYLARAWQRYQADCKAGYTLVCRDRRNRPVMAATYISAWSRACKKVGVHMPMYALRHIAASEMLAAGADLASVAAQLGHKNLTTTGAFYTHAVAVAQRRAAGFLPDFSAPKLVQFGAEFEQNIQANQVDKTNFELWLR